jgi:(1->4)-alpha-D-glucan 1-alpha-D-glucosylmutase
VRARLNVLSEMPEEWRAAVMLWKEWNAAHKSMVHGEAAPDANDEYLLYQTLVGAWPDDATAAEGRNQFRERMKGFMLKAVREAKANTTWTEPNQEYEEAIASFVGKILTDAESPFVIGLKELQSRVAFFGTFNSLAQTLLKITSPGVPDFYQGTELWDLNLVDPDNRRPVDYELRRRLLAGLREKFPDDNVASPAALTDLLETAASGAIKLYVIWRALQFRQARAELFARGQYVPLSASGKRADHVCAFARTFGDQWTTTVVPRFTFRLAAGAKAAPIGRSLWPDTVLVLPDGSTPRSFRNVLTGEDIPAIEREGDIVLDLADVLKTFPVALIERGKSL